MLTFKPGTDQKLNILCLGAHCDDIEIGAGATLLRLFKEYKINKVVWGVFTSDEIRKREAESSAGCFLSGITDREIIIHKFRDGFLPYQAFEVKEHFERLKRVFEPDIIFTHYRNDFHQDHRLINELTWNTWRNNTILEYEITKYDGDLGNPNLYIPVDEEDIDLRNQFLRENFVSQQDKHWFDENTFRSLARIRGVESATRFAEAFYMRKMIL